MRRTLLLFSTFIVATMGLDLTVEIATNLNITREEVESCFIETNVTFVDLIYLEINNNENFTAIGSKEAALKVSCLVTCVLQKKQMQMKEMMRSKQDKIEPDGLKLIYEVFDTWHNLGRNITNECEVSLQFLLCFINIFLRSFRSRENMKISNFADSILVSKHIHANVSTPRFNSED